MSDHHTSHLLAAVLEAADHFGLLENVERARMIAFVKRVAAMGVRLSDGNAGEICEPIWQKYTFCRDCFETKQLDELDYFGICRSCYDKHGGIFDERPHPEKAELLETWKRWHGVPKLPDLDNIDPGFF